MDIRFLPGRLPVSSVQHYHFASRRMIIEHLNRPNGPIGTDMIPFGDGRYFFMVMTGALVRGDITRDDLGLVWLDDDVRDCHACLGVIVR